MIALVETLELAVLAAVLFCAATAALSAVAFPLVRGRLARLDPAPRTSLLLALTAAPVAAGVLLTALCFLPGELGLAGFHDHCAGHPGHVHLCLVHHPPLDQGLVGWVVVILAAVALAGVAARQGLRLLRSARAVAALRGVARAADGMPGVHVIDADVPVSVAAGLVRPAVYLSSGFVRAVAPDVMAVVQAHERAHVRRRDPLRLLLANLLSMAHLPGTRRALTADLALATEQACDDEAVRAVGDRVRVARAVLTIERLVAAAPASPDLVAASFGGSHVPSRVETLLSDTTWRPARGLPAWTAAAALALLLGASPLHHVTETFLSWLTR